MLMCGAARWPLAWMAGNSIPVVSALGAMICWWLGFAGLDHLVQAWRWPRDPGARRDGQAPSLHSDGVNWRLRLAAGAGDLDPDCDPFRYPATAGPSEALKGEGLAQGRVQAPAISNLRIESGGQGPLTTKRIGVWDEACLPRPGDAGGGIGAESRAPGGDGTAVRLRAAAQSAPAEA